MRTELKQGDRIRLVHMGPDPDPLPPGALGTVRGVRAHAGWTQVDVAWDNGRQLMATLPPDVLEVIPKENEDGCWQPPTS